MHGHMHGEREGARIALRTLGAGAVAAGVKVDRLADLSSFDQLARLVVTRVEAKEISDTELHVRGLGGLDDPASVFDGGGDRLLDEEIYALSGDRQRWLQMQVIRRADADEIERLGG
ncbi:hypothetical protein AMC78_CH02560 [Rhizobium phaseoli]|nr:hypothetical protein AMC78_CH02560 [Rhizobium phaseoli]